MKGRCNIIPLALALAFQQIASADQPLGEVIVEGHCPTNNLSNVIAIAANANDQTCGFSVALKQDGTVVAWGYNWQGQTNVPPGLSNVMAISAGAVHVLALKKDGTVTAWGGANDIDLTVPAGLSGVAAISAGMYHSLALRSNGTVAAWGWHYTNESNVPAELTNLVAVAAGYDINLGLRSDGTVVQWNYGGIIESNLPAGLTNVVSIAAAEASKIALKADGSAIGWSCDGLYYSSSFVTNYVPGSKRVSAVAAIPGGNVVLQDDGTVLMWNSYDGHPIQMPAGHTNIIAVAAGKDHIVFLKLTPRISKIQFAGPNPAIRFHTFAGQNYSVLYSADLANWNPLPGGSVPGNGAECEVIDTSAVQDTRFYRLMQ